MAPIANKKVVIIGGTSGIGFAVAKAVLAEGGHVVVGSSSSEKVAAAAKRLDAGERVTAAVVDISSEASVKALFTKIGNFPDVDLASMKETLFDARFWGPLYCIKYSHGNIADSITLTGGIAVDRPRPGMGVGIGAAGAFMASMRTLAVDMAPLRFNCIMPGLVDTELLDTLPKEYKQGLMQKYGKDLPVKHVGEPVELAEAYLFAMKCTYLTGQNLYVDGGALLI